MSSGPDQATARVRELMERIADATGVAADVAIRVDEDGLTAEFVGEDLGALIGHHGQTIDAIQHLAYRFATHGDRERLPVVVDAAGYRERRAQPCARPPNRRPRWRSATAGPCPSRR